jgi:hypothetical protein
VIFDRTKRGVSDVPTFSANLKRKVNTSPGIVHADALSAGALSMLSVLRAGPVRGQTPGLHLG